MKASFSLLVSLLFLVSTQIYAQDLVKITPLGSHDGEFCRMDRAMLFEDPDGTRILYDAGRTVAGADDPRLQKLDAVLVSHVHGDHVGDKHIKAVNAGSCAKPSIGVTVAPKTNTAQIAAAKNALIITGSEMPKFFAKQLKMAGGDPKNSKLVRFGAETSVGKVRLTTVPATHSNGLSSAFLPGTLGELMGELGITAYVGPPTGYVINFSNGLTVYLSGDTGMTAEQKDVVGEYYKPELAVINIGGTFTTGPTEAAHVMNNMVKPKAVIASHANEAATENGKVKPGTRTALFSESSSAPVHIPLSGVTMSFDGMGNCKNGCTSL